MDEAIDTRLRQIADGELPKGVGLIYNGYVVTQTPELVPFSLDLPDDTVESPNFLVADNQRFMQFDLSEYNTVMEVKGWLDELDLSNRVEAL
jgi:hypothetical protein